MKLIDHLTDPCPNRKCDGGRVRFKNPVNPDVDLVMDCSECGGRGWTPKNGIEISDHWPDDEGPGMNVLVVPLSMLEEL